MNLFGPESSGCPGNRGFSAGGKEMDQKTTITEGRTALGIEFGSTRIKAVLTDYAGTVLAVGFHDWENSLVDGIWTYGLDEVEAGLQDCYASLKADVKKTCGVTLTTFGAMGISAMMHGYIALDARGRQLAPFQTWRNSNTQAAADELTEEFQFNIPLRWTIAHLYQRMLDGEAHVKDVDFVTTLDSYVHWKLTGEKVTGIGDASGIFPIDSEKLDYDEKMMNAFQQKVDACGYTWKAKEVFPRVLTAGQEAGELTAEGAAWLDPEGDLLPGVPLCPPEGDAGTGMVATNSVAPRTGNVSAGTSTFAMLVLEHGLKKLHREIDMVTTPTGYPVAMSHANNGTTDLNAWVKLFGEFCDLMGIQAGTGELFEKLYLHSLEGDTDCGGLLSYGYYSGEGITGIHEGRPLYARMPESRFTLANLMRSHLYTSLGAVKLGMDILLKDEGVKLDRLLGHGGFFKTEGVGQRYLAAAAGAPVTVMKTAGEGGPWGMAVLAAYLADGKHRFASLEEYLEKEIFAGQEGSTIAPTQEEIDGFEAFAAHYRAGLDIERAAVRDMNW